MRLACLGFVTRLRRITAPQPYNMGELPCTSKVYSSNICPPEDVNVPFVRVGANGSNTPFFQFSNAWGWWSVQASRERSYHIGASWFLHMLLIDPC